ncbi:MAG TPA: M48 family metallopeptidase [Micromonosporaceae bacterium]|jgi:STE24 endopeptidase
MNSRGWAVTVLVLLLIALGVLAAVLIPWHEAPAPRADQLKALSEIPPPQVARGVALNAALRPATYGSLVIGLVIALLLGLTPLGARIVTAVARPFGGGWIAQAIVGGLVIVFLGTLCTLPFSAWGHAVVHRYGLSTQGWGPWFVDVLKGYAVTAVIGAIALFGFYGVVRLSPRWWWAWGAAGAAGLVVLMSFVFPVLVEPIFNHFTPMPAGPLRSELIAMADRDGVPVKDVLIADASRRTTAVNAYVSGFGATRRIVVYDTLLKEATPAEVQSVVAHELGHAKDNDVLTGTLIGALGAAAAVIAVYLLGSWTGLLRLAGVSNIGEPRAIALLLAIGAIGGLLAMPVANLVSRHIEARADTHALRLTDDPGTFEAMQARLAQVNISDVDPNPFEFALFANHPSTVQRIAAGIAYAQGDR